MDGKKILFLGFIVLILTGCTKIDNNIDEIVNATMTGKTSIVNTASKGYELYIPMGVTQITDNDFNQKLKIKNRYIYLYVDTVSYYYKNSLNYANEFDYNYYYRDILVDGKSGYVGINKDNDSYFCVIVYNYSKIEFYTDIEDLDFILANALIIQNSIKFNDSFIELELDGISSEGKEIKYELDKPKDSESTFSKYLQEYVAEESNDEVVLPDDN